MAAAISIAAGEWGFDSAWFGGYIPGEGDTATATHAIQVTDPRVVGDSPAAGGTVLTIGVGGVVTITNTGSLTTRGDTALNGGEIVGQGQGQFKWDSSAASSPSTSGYAIKWTTDGANCKITIVGTSRAAPFVFDSVTTGGAANGRIDGTQANFSLRLSMENFRLRNMGTGSTVKAIDCSGFGGIYALLLNGYIESTVGKLGLTVAGGGSFSCNGVQSDSLQPLDFGGSGALTSNVRELKNSQFRGEVKTQAANATFENLVLTQLTNEDVSTASAAVWNNIVWLYNAGNGSPTTAVDVNVSGGELGPTFFLHTNAATTNPHYIGLSGALGARTTKYRGWIMQSRSVNSAGGDIFFITNQAGRMQEFSQIIGLPNWGGAESSGCIVNANGGGGGVAGKFRFNHSTVCVSGFFAGGIYLGESGAVSNEIGDSIRSNIFYLTAPGPGVVVCREQGTNPVLVGARVGYNSKPNFTGSVTLGIAQTDALGYVGTNAGALSTDPLDALTTDDTIDPEMVDPTRDLRSYARSLGYTGTDDEVYADVVDALYAIGNTTHPAYNASVSIAGFFTHVTDGHAPTNPATQSAHDAEVGGWRGAVEGVTAAVDTLQFDTQPSDVASGNAITPAVTVGAYADGVLNTSYSGPITISIVGSGSVLYGTVTVNAVAGVATFSNLVPGGAGGTFVLEATAAGYDTITSDNFAVTSGSLVCTESDMQHDMRALGATGEIVEVQLVDTSGNPITGLTFADVDCASSVDTGAPTDLALQAMPTPGVYVPRGFREIDDVLKPGAYAFGYPTFSATGKRTVFTFTGASIRKATLTVDMFSGDDGRQAVPDEVEVSDASVSAIQAGLATSTALATAQASLNLIGGYIDTEITALLANVAALQSTLNTVAGYVDTEVAATLAQVDTEIAALTAALALVKAKTDQMTFTVANQLDANTRSKNSVAVTGAGVSTNKWRGVP